MSYSLHVGSMCHIYYMLPTSMLYNLPNDINETNPTSYVHNVNVNWLKILVLFYIVPGNFEFTPAMTTHLQYTHSHYSIWRSLWHHTSIVLLVVWNKWLYQWGNNLSMWTCRCPRTFNSFFTAMPLRWTPWLVILTEFENVLFWCMSGISSHQITQSHKPSWDFNLQPVDRTVKIKNNEK